MPSPRMLRGLARDDGAARLRRLREILGFSQRELAVELGVAHGSIAVWEKGRRAIPGPVRKLLEIYEHELGLGGDDPAAGEGPGRARLDRIPASVPARAFALSAAAAGAARAAAAAIAGRQPRLGIAQRAQLAIADQVVQHLGEMKGFAMKIGQMVGYLDLGAPAAVRERFAALQTQSRPMSPAAVAQVFMEELGQGPGRIFREWSARPLAAASIGQVHRARLPGGEAVAVKVQYPRVVEALRTDLACAQLLERAVGLILRGSHLAPVVEELRDRFLEECDYRLEARQQERFRQLWAGRAGVAVPRVFGELSTGRILVSELMEGESLARFARRASQAERNRAGERLFDFAFESLFRHGLYNADPHPGNYLFGRDQVVFLDFGCVKRLSADSVLQSRRAARAILERDLATLREVASETGMVRDARRFDYGAQHRLTLALYEPYLQHGPWRFTRGFVERTWRMMWLENRNRFQTNLPRDWVFLPRLQWGLFSVLAELGAESDWRARLMDLIYEPGAARPGAYSDDELVLTA
jgi:predicted unusual protein kinase regulating ubiquinone biosynthesis (AarF/ABC1/UbiB family)